MPPSAEGRIAPPLSAPLQVFDHGRYEGHDMLDAIFDACAAAVRLFGLIPID